MSFALGRLVRSSITRGSSSNVATFDRYTTIRAFFITHQHRSLSTVKTRSICRLQTPPSRSSSAYSNHYWNYTSLRLIHHGVPSSGPNKKRQQRKNDEGDSGTAAAPVDSLRSTTTTTTTTESPSESTQLEAEEPTPPQHPPPNLENYSAFFRRLALSLPHLHRPTRDDFLNVANGFWQRARIRFKWLTIRSFRKFNADDISAFITWFVMSQTLWILVGTTTFFSVVFATVNSLRLQENVARAISDYLTSETGVTIIFESAIVPKWKDSRISFKNVYISRRPPTSTLTTKEDIGHRAAVGYDVANHPSFHHVDEENDHRTTFMKEVELDLDKEGEEECNYSMFDLTVDSIDVTLSLKRWLDGKGLVEDAVVKGVRGVLDRRGVVWDPNLEPATFRHPSAPGDFELDSLQLEDVLITVYQPGGFRPYTASIFHANIRDFRKRWIFYDLLSAESMVGQFDGCLFSLHRPQSIGRTNEMDLKEGERARMTRIRIDGVNIDHLNGSTSTTDGPVSWITSGKVDAVLDIKFPQDPSAPALNDILEEIADSITNSLAFDRIPGQRELAKPPLSAPEDVDSSEKIQDAEERVVNAETSHRVSNNEPDPPPKIVVNIDLRFRDLKAAVPMFPGELSYVNSALIRPIVAFMNANRTLVPIHCKVVKDLSDFDGSWTMWEAGLTDEISLKIYEALAYHVTQTNMNRRIKTVSIWSLQMTANAILHGLRNVLDPMTKHLRNVYALDYPSGGGYGYGHGYM